MCDVVHFISQLLICVYFSNKTSPIKLNKIENGKKTEMGNVSNRQQPDNRTAHYIYNIHWRNYRSIYTAYGKRIE